MRGAARVAVLGAGAVAQVVHLPVLTRMRHVEVVGLFDTNRSKANTLAQRFAIPRVYSTTDEMWAADDVEAVIVCTPSYLHEEQVLVGLDAGKYVFCEKPLALTADGTARIIEALTSRERLMVGMNQRFRPDSIALKQVVAAGDLGDVHYVRAGWLNRRAGRSPRSWRHSPEQAGGGALMDLGVQMLDLALWLLDHPEPKRVVAKVYGPSNAEVEDAAILLLELADGRTVNLEVSWTFVADRERQYLQVMASHGSASVAPLKIFKETGTGLADISPSLESGNENQFTASYRQELTRFFEAVRRRETIRPPVEQVSLMKIVEAAYRSAADRTEIVF
ncbi:MAG: Gfo/Idh/MocA family oxidoreductase [Gemmatimonadota bacterium]